MKKLLFSLLILWIGSSQAIVLEDLVEQKTLENTLKNKKICYYPGSFDPIHLGHEGMANHVLKNRICDYVIVFPALGKDEYKDRTDDSLRTEMLFAAFGSHPNVIVTKYNAKELQEALLKPADNSEQHLMVSKIEGVEYIGLLGSDSANAASKNPKYLEALMRGKQLQDRHKNTSAGTIAAIPATSFVVGVREGESIDNLHQKIGDRTITHIISIPQNGTSSTKVRELIKNNQDISPFVSKPVIEVINRHGLYKG